MPSRVVRQPNGKLALFSTVVDDFTIMNATVEEMLAGLATEMSLDEAEGKIRRGLDDISEEIDNLRDFKGLRRWCEALRRILFYHGWETAEERIREVLNG